MRFPSLSILQHLNGSFWVRLRMALPPGRAIARFAPGPITPFVLAATLQMSWAALSLQSFGVMIVGGRGGGSRAGCHRGIRT